MTDTTDWKTEAERLRAERDDARFEWQASERRAIEFSDILAQYIAAMRAAVLDGDAGMRWIKNTLAGPGHLPDGLGEHATAQTMFDAEVAEIEAHRAKHPIPEPVVGPLRAQIRTLTAERDAALAELERAREVLRGMEWDSWGYDRFGEGRAHCPCCGCTKDDGHAPDCALNAALAAKGE